MSDSATNAFLGRLAAMVERRRKAITMIHRTVLEVSTTVYLDTAARMAVPMLYAHWERYVRESLQSYLEHVEALKIPQVDANPALIVLCLFAELSRNGVQPKPRSSRRFHPAHLGRHTRSARLSPQGV